MNTYLKFPSIEEEEKYLDYINEYIKNENDKIIFCVPAQKNYKRWLRNVNLLQKGKYKNLESTSLYFLMDEEEIVGHIAIKHKLKLNKKDIITGNIEGSIRPTMRDNEYEKKALILALQKCKELNLEDVMVNCISSNSTFSKNIIDNGGILQKVLYDPTEDIKYRQFKIKIKK